MISDKHAFIASSDNKIYCLSLENGNKIWEYEAVIKMRPLALAGENELLFRGGVLNNSESNNVKLICLDKNGKLKWIGSESVDNYRSPILITDSGKLYVSSYRNTNPRTGGLYCYEYKPVPTLSPWPLFRQNVYGTGKMDTSLTVVDQPKSQIVVEGSALQLQVEALGLGDLKYQWKFNGENLN